MLLILVEVRGSVWITTFVTQDANQLQCFEHVTLRLNFIEPIKDSLVCLDSQELPRVVHPEMGDKYVTDFRIPLFRHLDTPFSPQAAKPVVGYT